MYRIDDNLCTGCGACVQDCPEGAIALVNSHASIAGERCTMCGACAQTCANGAIQWTDVVMPATIAGEVAAPQDARSSRAPVLGLTPSGAQGKTLPATSMTRDKQSGLWPMLGGALVWASRELLPEILALWRQNTPQQQTGLVSARVADLSLGGWRHRQRRHRRRSAR